jgi:hypothetical protein
MWLIIDYRRAGFTMRNGKWGCRPLLKFILVGTPLMDENAVSQPLSETAQISE